VMGGCTGATEGYHNVAQRGSIKGHRSYLDP
jgi:hypothetical protein